MKTVNVNELRAVDGGITYQTHCGYRFTDKSAWTFGKGCAHYAFCSDCQAAKKVWGYWYTFASHAGRMWK